MHAHPVCAPEYVFGSTGRPAFHPEIHFHKQDKSSYVTTFLFYTTFHRAVLPKGVFVLLFIIANMLFLVKLPAKSTG